MGERCNRTAEVSGSIPLGSTSDTFNSFQACEPVMPFSWRAGSRIFCAAFRFMATRTAADFSRVDAAPKDFGEGGGGRGARVQ
jgi:hypothetical protein